MSSILKKRINSLEQCLPDLPLPDVRLNIMVTDGRLNPPDPQPDRLGMVVVSGTHHQSGRVFRRADDETEEDFLTRVKHT